MMGKIPRMSTQRRGLSMRSGSRRDQEKKNPEQEYEHTGYGWVGELVRVSSPYTKIAGSILGQGTCKKQPMNT